MTGLEWVVEAYHCDAKSLSDRGKLCRLLSRMVEDLHLNPVGEPLWHQFPGPGGITGLCLLAESHWTCHTFPEHRSLTLNLFCCRPRPEWDFETFLAEEFGAGRVSVRKLERPYGGEA
ncbi:MAG: S-adenosylmethionine decarboxylase [Bryobacterales bacterium]|jgi:S-adenosylmethionine decarboxylase|nr:S-adenosylmethionine decarboxylase [Bryobacterales bacterium]